MNTKSIIYEGKDKTIMNAGHKLETVSSRLPYLYHMQISVYFQE